MVSVAVIRLLPLLLLDAPGQLVAHDCGEWLSIGGGRCLAGQWVYNMNDSRPGQTRLRTRMGGLCRWRCVPKVAVEVGNAKIWRGCCGEVCVTADRFLLSACDSFVQLVGSASV